MSLGEGAVRAIMKAGEVGASTLGRAEAERLTNEIDQALDRMPMRARNSFLTMVMHGPVIDEVDFGGTAGNGSVAKQLAEISERFTPKSPAACSDARLDVVEAIPHWAVARERVLGDVNESILAAHVEIARHAPIWYVPPELTELVDISAESVPVDTTLIPEIMVEQAGLAFLGAPVLRSLVEGGEAWHFNAIQWGPAIVAGRPAVLFCLLTRSPTDWTCVGESWWHFGDDIETPMRDAHELEEHITHVQDRRLIAALWLLSSQKGLTQSEFATIGRPAARRAAREFLPTDPIRVLRLRSTPHAANDGHGEVEWSHRWIVRGHWRQQPFGPGRSERRPVWIAPHVKGPEDKPLDTRQSVRILNPIGGAA